MSRPYDDRYASASEDPWWARILEEKMAQSMPRSLYLLRQEIVPPPCEDLFAGPLPALVAAAHIAATLVEIQRQIEELRPWMEAGGEIARRVQTEDDIEWLSGLRGVSIQLVEAQARVLDTALFFDGVLLGLDETVGAWEAGTLREPGAGDAP